MTGYVGAPNSLARLAQKLEESYSLRTQFVANVYRHVGRDLHWDREASSAAMDCILLAYDAVLADGGAGP